MDNHINDDAQNQSILKQELAHEKMTEPFKYGDWDLDDIVDELKMQMIERDIDRSEFRDEIEADHRFLCFITIDENDKGGNKND